MTLYMSATNHHEQPKGNTNISRLPRIIRHKRTHHIRQPLDLGLRFLMRLGRRGSRSRTRMRLHTRCRLMRGGSLLAGIRDVEAIRTPRRTGTTGRPIRQALLQCAQISLSAIILGQKPRQSEQRFHASEAILQTLDILRSLTVSAVHRPQSRQHRHTL